MTPVSPSSDRNRDVLGLALLSFASGATDVLAFLKLGHLFTSAMTGNMALLAIAIGQGDLAAAGRSLTALLGFGLGVALATLVNAATSQYPIRLLRLEIVFLVLCTMLWSASPEAMDGRVLHVVIVLSALSMGVQAIAARAVSVSGISTIVFTSVMVRIVAEVTKAFRGSRAPAAASRPSIASGAAAFVAYACGALTIALMASQQVRVIAWIPIAAVIFALIVWEVATKRLRRTA
jgi:uncharacterized membrane protein YoaK (UPF0700 family)